MALCFYSEMVLDQHELSGPLGQDARKRIREALLKQHHHQNHKKLANRIPIVRSFADIGKKQSEPHSMDKNGEHVVFLTHLSPPLLASFTVNIGTCWILFPVITKFFACFFFASMSICDFPCCLIFHFLLSFVFLCVCVCSVRSRLLCCARVCHAPNQ